MGVGVVVSSAQEEVEEVARATGRDRGGRCRRKLGQRLLHVTQRRQRELRRAGDGASAQARRSAAATLLALSRGSGLEEVLEAAGMDSQAERLTGENGGPAPVVAARVGERVEGLLARLGGLVGEVLEEPRRDRRG